MMKRHQTISLFCSVTALLLSMLLFSCTETGKAESTTAATDVATTAATDAATTTAVVDTEPQTLWLAENGKVNVRIVKPDYATDFESLAVMAIANSINRNAGAYPKMTTDLIAPGKSYNNDTLEILVGGTAYTQSQTAMTELAYGSWSVSVSGNKIVVAALGDNAITFAANALTNAFIYDRDTESIGIDTALSLSGVANTAASELPRYTGGVFKNMFDAGEGSQLVLQTETDEAGYSAYLDSLIASGYTKTATNTIDGNRFDFFEKSGIEVTLSHMTSAHETRIAVGTASKINGTDGAKVCSLQMTFLGLAYDTKSNGTQYPNGLSLIIRLTDGRFIIVDGGGNNDTHARLVYDTLVEQAPDSQNIVIAAWILTHAHVDHVGVLNVFSSSYTNRVTVQNFISNIPTDVYLSSLSKDSDGDVTGMASEARSAVRKFAGASVIKAHLGQKFSFSGTEIEMLYTVEANYPYTSATNMNSTSLVFSVMLGDKKLIVTGDCSNDSSNLLCRYYKTALKCDYMTANHHGYGGGTILLYSLMNPQYVLWPSSEEVYNETRTRDYNQQLLNNPNVKSVYVAGTEKYNFTFN